MHFHHLLYEEIVNFRYRFDGSSEYRVLKRNVTAIHVHLN